MPPHHQVLAPFLPVAAAATLSELLLGDGLVSFRVRDVLEKSKTDDSLPLLPVHLLHCK